MTNEAGLELIKKSLRRLFEISFPPAVAEVLAEATRPEPDIRKISRVLSLDPALAAAVLSLVNSAFYGLPGKIADLDRAAVVLGAKEITRIALAVTFQGSMFRHFRQDEAAYFARWRGIIWSAVAARLISRRISPEVEDQAYLAALLKDISILLLACMPDADLPPQAGQDLDVCFSAEGHADSVILGQTHGQLTAYLLENLNLPAETIEAVVRHHDLDGFMSHGPTARAVILATRWADLELGDTPGELVQFEQVLKARLGLDDASLDGLRRECVDKFRSLLATLHISEDDPSRGYYRHSLAAMQRYFFLSMDLTNASGGLMAVAGIISRHLQWEFGVLDWELALRIPGGEDWFLFQKENGGRMSCCLTGLVLDDLNWRLPPAGFFLQTAEGRLGELRLPPEATGPASSAEIQLYLRFAADAYEHYSLRHAVLEAKAHTLDNLPLGVGRLDLKGRLLEANRNLRDFLGIDAYAGLDMMDLLTRAKGMPLDPEWEPYLTNPAWHSFSRIFCPMVPDNRVSDACFYISAHKTTRDGFSEVLVIIENVSEVTGLQFQALRQRDFLERLVESMRDLVLTLDGNGRITYASPRWSDRLIGRNFFQIAKPLGAFTGKWTPAYPETADKPVELLLLLDESKAMPVEAVFSPLKSGVASSARLVVARDLTTIRRLEDELKRQAIYDGLTGIFNHYQFNVILAREAVRSQRTKRVMGLVFFDLDGFKKVNDTLGHQFGDRVLSSVGRIMRENVRKGTDFACRYGGDEFAVIVTEVEPAQMEVLAGRLMDKIATEFQGRIGLSIGLATLKTGESPHDMVRRADQAVFTAKGQGGHRFVWAAGNE